MKILFEIRKLLKHISSSLNKLLRKNTTKSLEAEEICLLEDNNPDENVEELKDIYEEAVKQEKEKIKAEKKALTTRLYILEQEIEVFKYQFPKPYSYYLGKIKEYKENYDYSVEKSSENLTFEIDPEEDRQKSLEIEILERSIKKFINTEVRFDILSKKLQTLALKLNILYNTSIFHFKEEEKKKVLLQSDHAKEAEKMLIQELKDNEYILQQKRLKERLIMLIAYIDYQILKINLRNSNIEPKEVIDQLSIKTELEKFDIFQTFESFIQDEVGDLLEPIHLLCSEELKNSYTKEVLRVLQEITLSKDSSVQILDSSFWNSILVLESEVLKSLVISGQGKEKAQIKVIDKLEITVTENEVLTLPKTNANLALIGIYSATQDEKILLLIKLFKHLTEKITYKEIYFLLLLFDAISIFQNTKNGLIRYIRKYIDKYPYDSETLEKRRKSVNQASSKNEYVKVFELDEDFEKIVKILENLNIDFTVIDNNIYINSFYFSGLENVLSCLEANNGGK